MRKSSPPAVSSSLAPGSYFLQGLRQSARWPAFISMLFAKNMLRVRSVSDSFHARSRA